MKIDKLRLRMKVYTDRVGQRYLASAGTYDPNRDRIVFVAMRDDGTHIVSLSGEEWNDLPYYFFEERERADKPDKTWPRSDRREFGRSR